MRIATWNVERLKHIDKLDRIRELCRNAGADIIVLTETDSRLKLEYANCFSTPAAADVIPGLYADTENRVSIYTDYPLVRSFETYDKYTAVCVELETEFGNLIVYGTIMGIFGNREKSYMIDLPQQIDDIKRLSARGNLCVIGDYNCSFSDNYYFTVKGRNSITEVFCDRGISILTEEGKECIDHIAVSDAFVGESEIVIDEWNYEKELSDHKGIVVDIKRKAGEIK